MHSEVTPRSAMPALSGRSPGDAAGVDLRLYAVAIAALIGMRFVGAGLLPLYLGDEPYYWVWSRNLAWGYFDHPPGVAALIRAGTALFGDTEFGVRCFGVALSIPATLCVWRTGTLLLGGTDQGARAALFFNLMLLVNGVTLLATPDAPVMACSAAFLWAVVEADARRDGRWWLLAGLFAGLGLLSKYTILFVGAGVFLWLLLSRSGRMWLRTPWPWLGGVIVAVLFAPNVIWNASQEGGALGFQFGRLGYSGRSRWYYLPQFLVEQFILTSPFIAILGAYGLWHATKARDRAQFLIATLLWPTIVFLALYALRDRIHRNWMDVVYPALAIAAADGFRRWNGPRFVRTAAVPTAVAILIAVYAQALFRIVPIGQYDPLNHQLASGMPALAAPIAEAIKRTGAKAIVTADFPLASWTRFYAPVTVPVILFADGEDVRFPFAPKARADVAEGALYVARQDNMLYALQAQYSNVEPVHGLPPGPFLFYRLTGFKDAPFGRMLCPPCDPPGR